jgi:hypothetical protein
MYRILSIDAWRDGSDWTWNNWFHVDDIDDIPPTNRRILKLLREIGLLSEYSKGRVYIEDDQYNIVVRQKSNHMPLYAIEYGNTI